MNRTVDTNNRILFHRRPKTDHLSLIMTASSSINNGRWSSWNCSRSAGHVKGQQIFSSWLNGRGADGISTVAFMRIQDRLTSFRLAASFYLWIHASNKCQDLVREACRKCEPTCFAFSTKGECFSAPYFHIPQVLQRNVPKSCDHRPFLSRLTRPKWLESVREP